jgi:hypothetical protein
MNDIRQTAAYKAGMYAYYRTCLKQELNRLALDELPNGTPPQRFQKLVALLKRTLDPQSFELAMKILRDEDEWPGQHGSSEGAVEGPQARKGFDRMFPSASRIGQDEGWNRQPNPKPYDGMSAEAEAQFDALFPNSPTKRLKQ